MGSLGSHVLLLLLSLLFYVASSLYLDQRHPNVRTDRNYQATYFDPKASKFEPSGGAQVSGRRSSERDKRKPPQTTGSYINCVIKVGSGNQPTYDCTHSEDVKIKWTEEDGRLKGTFTANFNCPARRVARNEMQSPQLNSGRRSKTQFQDKQKENDETAAEKDKIEESQAAPSTDAEEKSSDELEEGKGEHEEQKVASDEAEAPEENKEAPAAEKEEGAEATDKEVPATENSGEDGKGEEAKGDKDDKDKGEDGKGEEAKGEKGDKDEEDDGDVTLLVPIQAEIDTIVSESEMPQLNQMILQLLSESGNYLLSFLMKNLKQKLRDLQIGDMFDRKIEALAETHGNNTDKALRSIKKKIHKEFGKSYQLEIVKHLKKLQEGLSS